SLLGSPLAPVGRDLTQPAPAGASSAYRAGQRAVLSYRGARARLLRGIIPGKVTVLMRGRGGVGAGATSPRRRWITSQLLDFQRQRGVPRRHTESEVHGQTANPLRARESGTRRVCPYRG